MLYLHTGCTRRNNCCLLNNLKMSAHTSVGNQIILQISKQLWNPKLWSFGCAMELLMSVKLGAKISGQLGAKKLWRRCLAPKTGACKHRFEPLAPVPTWSCRHHGPAWNGRNWRQLKKWGTDGADLKVYMRHWAMISILKAPMTTRPRAVP